MDLTPLDYRFYLTVLISGILFTLLVALPLAMRGAGLQSYGSLGFLTSMVVVWGIVFLAYGFSIRRTVEIHDRGVTIKSSFYTISVPAIDIKGVNLISNEDAMSIDYRTNGVSLPGWQSGWFRGKGKRIFADYVSSPNIAIATTKGVTIVLEVREPDVFLAESRKYFNQWSPVR